MAYGIFHLAKPPIGCIHDQYRNQKFRRGKIPRSDTQPDCCSRCPFLLLFDTGSRGPGNSARPSKAGRPCPLLAHLIRGQAPQPLSRIERLRTRTNGYGRFRSTTVEYGRQRTLFERTSDLCPRSFPESRITHLASRSPSKGVAPMSWTGGCAKNPTSPPKIQPSPSQSNPVQHAFFTFFNCSSAKPGDEP
jgi:hypothetical protein